MLSNIKRRLSLDLIQKISFKKFKTDDFNVINLNNNNKWYKLQISGNVPEKRSGHNTVVIDNKLYLFGGCSCDESSNIDTVINDMYIFNLDTHEWTKLLQKNTPSNRATFGICSTNYNSFIISGGVDFDNTKYSDLYEYSISTNEWEKINDNIINKVYGHSINIYNNNYIIFGGTIGLHYYNKLYEYNLITNKYNEIFN